MFMKLHQNPNDEVVVPEEAHHRLHLVPEAGLAVVTKTRIQDTRNKIMVSTFLSGPEYSKKSRTKKLVKSNIN